ncbi:unnamed protein product [Rangifer tarandus platyrhynchus]|uniref:Uncharacterized protein n=1 Tax=Rangifer tarandus platyrhynchus TaxID=3082113 RepID=A0ABN8XVJ2_RANTA|nr:unnamed protein product [Rangifer tarandus platyrhynchus]
MPSARGRGGACWEHLLEPKRLRDPLAAGDWKQRNQMQTVLGCWGGRGPNLSVLASFPQGWDLGEEKVVESRELLWNPLHACGGTSRGRRIRPAQRKLAPLLSRLLSSALFSYRVQKFLNSFPRPSVILTQKNGFFFPFFFFFFRTLFTFSAFGCQPPGRLFGFRN